MARKPLAVVPWKVELLKVRPPEVAVAPGAQAAPKQPFVKPAMKTSSARATPWASVKRATAKTDRKSTRLNSSHGYISHAVFCSKKQPAAGTFRVRRAQPPAAHFYALFSRRP